jgi:predicted kinase
MNKPLFIGTLGYPGSGKTYFSEHLARERGLVHLHADTIRAILFETPRYTSEEHGILFRTMDYLAEQFLNRGIGVIYDANANFRSSRKKFAAIAARTTADYHLVWIKTPEALALERLTTFRRDTPGWPQKPADVFNRMKQEMELPEPDEPVIEIDGSLPFAEQYKQFLQAVHKSG